MIKKIIIIIIIISAISLNLTISVVCAALNLSVNPIDGGNSLRFGRIDTQSSLNKEVKLRISSTGEGQYQVFQRLVDPFINQRGQTANINAIQSSSLSGSNSSGSLYLQDGQELTFSDELIYTSDSNGMSDSFTLIYQVNPAAFDISGNYYGKIIYTVRPVSGSQQDQFVLNMFFDLSEELSFEVKSDSGLDIVRLDSQNISDGVNFEFDINNSFGSNVKIYSELINPIVNDLGNKIDYDSINLTIDFMEGNSGVLSSTLKLNDKSELICDVDQSVVKFILNFKLNKDKILNQIAGKYFGKIRFSLESEGLSKTHDVDIEINIQPTFELYVKYPEDGMGFSKLIPTDKPKEKEVLVTVNSNIGKPYFVNQSINAFLINEDGCELDKNNFEIKQKLIEGYSGRIENAGYQPILSSDTAIFYSDNIGSSAKFKVFYRLTPYLDMKAGNYKASLIYSLGEI